MSAVHGTNRQERLIEGQRLVWSPIRGGSTGSVERRARRSLEPNDGLGSVTIETSHKIMAFFGVRSPDGTVCALDHGAPLFA